MRYCEGCGAGLKDNVKFCPCCGRKCAEATDTQANIKENAQNVGQQKQKKKSPKGSIVIASVCLVVVLIAGMLIYRWYMGAEDRAITDAVINYEEVNDTLTELITSQNYAQSETFEKAEQVLELLRQLENEGQIAPDSIEYDESIQIIAYEYANGAYGGVMLEDFAEGISGIGEDLYGTTYSYDATSDSYSLENWPAVPVFDSDAFPYEEQNLRAIMMYGLGDDHQDYLELAKLEQTGWGQAHLVTTLDDDCTLSDFRTKLTGNDLIIIQEHGVVYKNDPLIILQETITFSNYLAKNAGLAYTVEGALYLEDLQEKRIAMIHMKNGGFQTGLLPEFFTYYYSQNQLEDAIVWLGCCDGYRNDTLVKAFADCGAKAVLACTETVSTAYNYFMQDAFVYMLLYGNTVEESLDYAKSVWGENDKVFVEAYSDTEDNNPSEVRIYNGSKKTLVTLTKAAAASIPINIDYENLVTDAYADEITGEYGDCFFAIPQINIAGGVIEAVNKEIWDELYVGVVQEIQANLPYIGDEYIKYDWAVNGNILSLWIESHPVDWTWWDYYVYNISISDRALISKESLLNTYGLGISEYNELVRKALYSFAYRSLSTMVDANPDLGTIAFANEILSNTTSDTNVAEARPFLDKNGCLCIVGLVYSLTGADAYYHIINLEDLEVSAEYPEQFTLPAGQQNVLSNILGDWTDGYMEYRFFANETFEENSVFFSSVNRQLINRSNIEEGVIEVTGINTADLAPYVQPNALQTRMELIYDSLTDTVYVGNTSHPYYREDVWMSGNIPEVNTPPGVETATGNTYGDNVSWTITDGVLRAAGVGKMENFAEAGYVPWYDERGRVTTVIMESGITTVGSYAFDGFGKLTSVTLPDTIRSIEECAFWRCDDLPSIVIPNGCTTIMNSAFNWCESLEYIVLPASVTEIMWNAFANCDDLYDVYYSGTEEQWRRIDISSIGNEALTSATIHFNSTGPDQ